MDRTRKLKQRRGTRGFDVGERAMRKTPYTCSQCGRGAGRRAACAALPCSRARARLREYRPRVIRRTKATPRSSSRRRTARPTVDLGTPSFFAAAESEPDSATSTNMRSFFKARR